MMCVCVCGNTTTVYRNKQRRLLFLLKKNSKPYRHPSLTTSLSSIPNTIDFHPSVQQRLTIGCSS
jgi:hypothetical protein